MVRLDVLNNASDAQAEELLSQCCGSKTWVAGMLKARPFSSEEELFKKADDIWFGLENDDWLEAFSHHPRIGEKHLREKFANTADWSSGEQAGMDSADEDVIAKLAKGNAAYDDKFGFVFWSAPPAKVPPRCLASLRRAWPTSATKKCKTPPTNTQKSPKSDWRKFKWRTSQRIF